MLSAIRSQQKSILIVVSVIVIISFAWLYNRNDTSQLGQLEAFSINGRSYRISEAQKLMRTYDMALRLGLYNFAISLFGPERRDGDRTDYAIGLLVLRDQAIKIGVAPSNEEIGEFIKNLPPFRTAGQYDANLFNAFTTDMLTPNGFTDGDLYQLVGDAISFTKIQDLLGANIHESPDVIDEGYAEEYTSITAARVNFARDSFAEGVKAEESEIADYHEKNKATLLAGPKRRIEYVFFQKPEGLDKLEAEEKKKKLAAHGAEVSKFTAAVLADEADFAAAAKSAGHEVVRTEAFASTDPPEALAGESALLAEIFRRTLEVPVSDPV
ncbi:MAG: SurA N-terminal domain-containing protein, partial [Verrucomicrobiales bacterium]